MPDEQIGEKVSGAVVASTNQRYREGRGCGNYRVVRAPTVVDGPLDLAARRRADLATRAREVALDSGASTSKSQDRCWSTLVADALTTEKTDPAKSGPRACERLRCHRFNEHLRLVPLRHRAFMSAGRYCGSCCSPRRDGAIEGPDRPTPPAKTSGDA